MILSSIADSFLFDFIWYTVYRKTPIYMIILNIGLRDELCNCKFLHCMFFQPKCLNLYIYTLSTVYRCHPTLNKGWL